MGFYGGGMYDDSSMMMEESSGIIAILNGLPAWLSTIILVLAVILAAMFAGWLFGKIVGNLIYPDPDKETVFGRTQRILIFAVIVITIGVTGSIIYDEITPDPIEDIPVDGMVDGMGGMDGMVDPSVEGMIDDAVEGMIDEAYEGEILEEGIVESGGADPAIGGESEEVITPEISVGTADVAVAVG